MTDEQIDAMGAGPEMDRAVAHAIGHLLPERWDESIGATGRAVADTLMKDFHPSTDWNDAMFAAERYGLWDRHTFGRDSVYCVWECDGPNEALFAVAKGETGQLAINRAILKLANRISS